MKKLIKQIIAILIICCIMFSGGTNFGNTGLIAEAQSDATRIENSTFDKTVHGKEVDKGSCGTDVNYILYEDGMVYIYGEGKVSMYISLALGSEQPWRYATNAYIETGVTEITHAFYGCSDLTSVEISNGLTSIGTSAFYECSNLTSIEIPDSVTSIGNGAFEYCSSLTSIEIPKSVTYIFFNPFEYCSSLKSLKVDSENKVYDSRNNCNAIIGTRTNTLIIGCQNTKIPDSVTSIETFAFSGCSGLTNIEIPGSVADIKYNPFADCSNLKSIRVDPENKIYDSRNNCNAIIETDANTLIVGCQDTKIPSSVTKIGDYAFSGCRGLTNIEIPSSVTSIGNWAFNGCSGLTNIEIPSSVADMMEDNPFTYCSNLKSIRVDPENKIYDSRNNCNAIIETETNTLIAGCQNTKIPSSVISIGCNVFMGCRGLTNIEIPSSVTSIGCNVFMGCSNLMSIVIPSSVINIGDGDWYVFDGCDNLTIYGKSDSYAQEYADECNIPFKDLSEYNPTESPIPTETAKPLDTPTNEPTKIPTETASSKPNETEKPVEIELGKVDENDSIDAKDALVVLKYAAKLTELSGTQKIAADVNKDGDINAKDALMILQYSAKLILGFE